jgi:hypothetical protein
LDALFFPAPASRATATAEDSLVTDWHTQALERIAILAELTMQNPDTSALEVQSRFFDLMSLFFTNTVAQEGGYAEGSTAYCRGHLRCFYIAASPALPGRVNNLVSLSFACFYFINSSI